MSRATDVAGSVSPARPIRVLHVDDDEAILDLTAEFVERADDRLTVRSVSDPRSVPALLRTEPVDCVVTDKRMPECDGLELCRRVREAHPDLPVVVFTSERGADVAERARAAGATDYVAKSPGVEQYEVLTDRIRAAVRDQGDERGDGSDVPGAFSGPYSTA